MKHLFSSIFFFLSNCLSYIATNYWLPVGSFTIGRQGCNILVNDRSVSRQHAVLTVKHYKENLNDPSQPPQIFLLDKSKFGTSVNGVKVEQPQKKDSTTTTIQLNNGDTLRFGICPSIFQLSYQPTVFYWEPQCSRLTQEQKLQVMNSIRALGAHVNGKPEGSTHSLMIEVEGPSNQVILSRVAGLPFVSPAWLEAILKRATIQTPPPPVQHYQPQWEESPLSQSTTIPTDLLRGTTVVFFSRSQFMDLKKVILALSGTAIENYDLKEAGLRKLFEQLRDTPFTLIDPLVRSSSLNERIDTIKEKQLQKKLLRWKEIAGEECIVTSDTLRKAIIRGDVSDCFPMQNKRKKDVLDEMDEEKENEGEKEEEEKEDEAKEKAAAIDPASEKADKTEERENELEKANKEKKREKEREEDVMIIASSPPTSSKVNETKVNTMPKQTEASNDNRRPKKRKAIDLSEELKHQAQETEAKAPLQKENERPALNNAKKSDSTKGESKALSSPSVQQQREEEREEDTPFRERIMIIQETKLVARPLAPSSSSGSPSQQQNFKRFRRKANGQTTTQPRRASTGTTSSSRTVVKCVLDEERGGASPTGKSNKEMERWLQEAQEEAKREEEENHVAEELWNAVKHKSSSTSSKVMKMRMSASAASSSASSKKSGSLVLPSTKRRKSSFV
ncbi:NIPLB protein (Fragment), variant 3 [Balamuthia mandrillaris]